MADSQEGGGENSPDLELEASVAEENVERTSTYTIRPKFEKK